MKQKTTFILILLAIFVFTSTTVLAQKEKDVKVFIKKGEKELEWIGEGEMGKMKCMNMMKKLNLTEDQKKKFEKMHFDMQKKQIEARAKVKTAQVELKELLNADNLDKSAIEKKIKDIADLKVKLRLNHIDHWFAINKILIPEQQKVWKEKLDRPMKRMQMRMRMDCYDEPGFPRFMRRMQMIREMNKMY